MSSEDNPSVLIRVTPNFEEEIEHDLELLQSQIERLPGNLDVNIETQLVLRAQNTPTTYFGRERIFGFSAICEFPDTHFNENSELRNIILLHELIHASQRQRILRNWDIRIMERLREYTVIGQIGVQMALDSQRVELIRNHNALKCVIEEFYKIIFEAWNHLEMRTNFSQFFENELINVHARISHGTQNGMFDSWNEDFMFHMFAKLLEATFFAKITENILVSFDYIQLAGFWRNKLRKVSTVEQFRRLISVLDTMTNPNNFPNSAILENQYDVFCNLLWERRVFET